MEVAYNVTFYANPTRNMLHRMQHERKIATVKAIEDSDTFRAYHLHNGKHLRPDYDAIRKAIPYRHRKAFDRAGNWFFPLTLNSELSCIIDMGNAASLTLYSAKGKCLGSLYAVPHLESQQ